MQFSKNIGLSSNTMNVYFKHGFRYLKWQQKIENERLKAKALKKIQRKLYRGRQTENDFLLYTHVL